MEKIRSANLDDIQALIDLENRSFPENRRSNRKSIKLSIVSNHQEVFILEDKDLIGSIIIQFFKHSARIYSLAVNSEYRGKGYGSRLLIYCENYLRSKGIHFVSLEADLLNKSLISLYEKSGYKIKKLLEDYYGDGEDACRMIKKIDIEKNKGKIMKNIIVSDDFSMHVFANQFVEIVLPRDYINEDRFQKSANYRIFNLCSNYEYQSKGYYISLLASARDHRVIPSVATMQDFSNSQFISFLTENIRDLIKETLKKNKSDEVEYFVIFGYEVNGQQTKLSKYFYDLLEAPFLKIIFKKNKIWYVDKINLLSSKEISSFDKETLKYIAGKYFSQKKYNRRRIKNYEYDLAILTNPDELNPPSDKAALDKFKKVGEKQGFYVEFITKDDINRIKEFDALFIRETTAVNDHTYQISRYAYAEGLIVIDDPWSILKCSNKFYLMERMNKANIPTPKSCVLTREDNLIKKATAVLKFPMIIKKPDSAFSLGVYKVKTEEEFLSKCSELLEESEFIVAQEYLPSDYDWRIGVLDNEVIFACKYYMARGHWQIYNWEKENDKEYEVSGMSETIEVKNVPSEVIDIALKATSYIGDGLYGVDIKTIDGKAYIIEVNDNPNIDNGIEDLVLGDGLYSKIFSCIKDRIVKSRNSNKYIDL